MTTEVVDLSSDSDSEIEVYRETCMDTRRNIHEISASFNEEEFPEPILTTQRYNTAEEIDFSFATFTQLCTESLKVPPVSNVEPPNTSIKLKDTNQNKALEKAIKAANSANKKCHKISDCMKYITAYIDPRLLDSLPSSGSILTHLQASGTKHCIEQSPVPRSIYWKRERIEYFVDEGLQVCSRASIQEEDEALIIIPVEEITKNFIVNCCKYFDEISQNLRKEQITILLYGMEKYLKDKALAAKQQFRNHLLNDGGKNSQKRNSSDETAEEINSLKIQLILQKQCSVWPVETPEELARTIVHFTKAIGERPFKEERNEMVFEFFAPEANAGGVRVSKDGQGLTRLWQQQIQQYPLASLETAQAVISKYPTPDSLIKAYEKCTDEKAAALLLQDIPVRRNAGPLSATRRVGPELSKRIHTFCTSKDGKIVL